MIHEVPLERTSNLSTSGRDGCAAGRGPVSGGTAHHRAQGAARGALVGSQDDGPAAESDGVKKSGAIRVPFDAGHGLGSTRTQVDEQRADEYAFVLWRTGARGFQVNRLPGRGTLPGAPD